MTRLGYANPLYESCLIGHRGVVPRAPENTVALFDTVNNEAALRELAGLGRDGIVTDHPVLLQGMLSAVMAANL